MQPPGPTRQPQATTRQPQANPRSLQATTGKPQVPPGKPQVPPAALLVALGELKAAEVAGGFALSDKKSAWRWTGGDHGGSSGCHRRRYGLKFIFKF